MKILNLDGLTTEAGLIMFKRNMSTYNGKPFECACGETHNFDSKMIFQNYATNGVNAKMIITCPSNANIFTLVTTKYKFLVIFDFFESLAGSK